MKKFTKEKTSTVSLVALFKCRMYRNEPTYAKLFSEQMNTQNNNKNNNDKTTRKKQQMNVFPPNTKNA